MKRKLIVNADDFGYTPGVTEGILQAHKNGILTSTTVMVNMPGAEDALLRAKDYPVLGIGLHLDFSSGAPVLQQQNVPSLVDQDGKFKSRKQVWGSDHGINKGELQAELTAQIVRFFEITGRLPDHLDCHHFSVNADEAFFNIYLELAKRWEVPVRMIYPSDQAIKEVAPFFCTMKGDSNNENYEPRMMKDKDLIEESGLSYPDYFVFSFFGEDGATFDHLTQILESVPPGTTELMCHPGLVDETLSDSSYGKIREKELELLCNPDVLKRIEKLDIELINYSVYQNN